MNHHNNRRLKKGDSKGKNGGEKSNVDDTIGNNHEHGTKSPSGKKGLKNNNGQLQSSPQSDISGARAHPNYPMMTLICHRVDLFDDFDPAKSGTAEIETTTNSLRCLGIRGGCACLTPCIFCHSLKEDENELEGNEPKSLREMPLGLHPGFAFLFSGDATEENRIQKTRKFSSSDDSCKTEVTNSLVLDPIFAQNHGLIKENSEEGNVIIKKYHPPPIGKYKYSPPLMELPKFFCDMSEQNLSNKNFKLHEEANFEKEVDGTMSKDESYNQLNNFFDDFVTTTPSSNNNDSSQASHEAQHKDKKTLIIRSPTKTVVTKTHSSIHFGGLEKCLCQSRYENLKEGLSPSNPHDPSIVHNKYWAQRRRLFHKFDKGIQLDAEGWYSVTPEVVADHVARRFSDAATKLARSNLSSNRMGRISSRGQNEPMVILDAFCGCGGNAIAFAKLSSSVVSLVVCIDVDREKLRMAAHNASIYSVPPNRIMFVEANSVAVMERCYKDGNFVMDPPPRTHKSLTIYPPREIYDDFAIGGIDLLSECARHIDAIFMDPPWGGIDYVSKGKDGYHLGRDMKIQGCERGDVGFPPTPDVDGIQLLRIAAGATSTRFVVYDLPRNVNKQSLVEAALNAGYEGNAKLEEHYINGTLKTVAAYFGLDFRHLMN